MRVVCLVCAVTLGVGSAAGSAQAQDDAEARVERKASVGRLELGTMVGTHIFADDLELGVADEPMDSTAPQPLALFGIRVGFVATSWLSVEGEVNFIPTSDRFYGDNVIVIGGRLHGLAYLAKPEKKVRPFLVVGVGTLAAIGDGKDDNHIGNDADFVPHWGAGLRIALLPNLGLRLDGRHLLAPDTSDGGLSNDFELQVGIALALGGAEVRTLFLTERVPIEVHAEVKDTDKDFITDDKDGCPNDPEDVDTWQDDDGCPEADNDNDGLLDAVDVCPNEAEVRNQVDDEDGCPEVDSDKDGVIGSTDKCPDVAEDLDSFQDEDGCPDPDNDGDGVEDPLDKCPKELETKNGYEDSDGCKDDLPKEIKKYTGVMEGITFKKNSSDVKETSYKLLDRAAGVLIEYPALKLEISGHTSDEGDRDFNMNLSLERANAVKTYLVNKGVPADRITTAGKGPDEPIAKGKSKKARERNRRIEFKLLTQ
jgi:outer membrane protein OmpA-like peptidoglycan-associated protein